jgi:hypothetical protein
MKALEAIDQTTKLDLEDIVDDVYDLVDELEAQVDALEKYFYIGSTSLTMDFSL